MDSLLDGASAPTKQSSRAEFKMPPKPTMASGTAESAHFTQSAHEHMVAVRHQRIASIAYLIAEARGFEPGHDAEDWHRAQTKVDAEDAGFV